MFETLKKEEGVVSVEQLGRLCGFGPAAIQESVQRLSTKDTVVAHKARMGGQAEESICGVALR